MNSTAPVRSLVFSGSTSLASSTASELRLKKLETGQNFLLRNSAESFGLSPVFSPDGRVLAIGGHGPDVSLWDADKGAELEPLTVGPQGARSIAFSPDGTTLAVASGKSPAVTLWAWPGRRQLAVLDGRRGSVNLLAFSPDGSRLLVSDSGSEVSLWDVASRKEWARRRAHKAGITALAFSPDGHLFVTAGYLDLAVRFWDSVSGEPRGSLPGVLPKVTGLGFSPDCTTLAISRGDGVASLWELDSGRQIGAKRDSIGSFQAVAFSGDGRVLATGGFDGSVRLWDVSRVWGRDIQGGPTAL